MRPVLVALTWQHVVPVAVFFVTLVLLFWLTVVRPAGRRAREHWELVRSLRPGDKIVTAGGIYGTITAVHERTVEVEVSKGLVLTFDRYAIRRRQGAQGSEARS
jgi:preprotein translocase subunit YajC